MTDEARQRVETLRNVEFDDCIEFPYAVHTMLRTAADLIEQLSAQCVRMGNCVPSWRCMPELLSGL